jgi:hypothetical protein
MRFSTLTRLARHAPVVSISALLVACAVQTSSPGEPNEVGYGGGSGSSSGGSSTAEADGGSGTGTPSEYPILAPIDTNATMTAAPGQGVGVFTQYKTGGQWTVWWTCDTYVDAQNPPCLFDVKISVTSGSLSQVATQGFQTSDTLTSSATQIEGVTATTTGSDGVTFTTEPGAVITLSATVGGQYDGRFIFFVEGGKVDDGFTGTVTDPIMLQGATP